MKKIAFLLLLLVSAGASGQRFYLEVTSASAAEQKAIDSVGYVKIHPSPKAANDQAKTFWETTRKLGWLECEIVGQKKKRTTARSTTLSISANALLLSTYI